MDQLRETRISDSDLAMISTSGLFSNLAPDDVKRLVSDATVATYPAQYLLFNQGDPADGFYIVLDGKVKVYTSTEGGSEGVVEIFMPVRSFGEAAIFAGGLSKVNAEVLEPSRLVFMPAQSVLRHLREDPSLALTMLGTLARRQRMLLRQLKELKLKTPGQRLGCFLLSLMPNPEGSGIVQLPFDKNVIAGKLGIKPESLSRAMGRLREVGVVCQGNSVIIDDVAELRSFCDEAEDKNK